MMFTGSTATGRTVAQKAGEQLIGVSAELGGKNAMVVTGDADLDRAVDGAVVGLLRQHRPAVHLDRAHLRGGAPGRPVRRRVRRPHPDAAARRRAVLRRRRRRAGLRRTSWPRSGPTSTTRVAKGATLVAGGKAPAGRRAAVLRADRADRRHAGHGPVPGGDVRPGRGRLPGGVRRRGGGAGQRHRVRAQRQRLLRRHRPGPGHRRAAPGRDRQRQRRLRLGVGQRRTPPWAA